MPTRACKRCARPVSRYNTDAECNGCSMVARSGHSVPAWLWDSDQLRRALAALDLGSAIGIIRHSAGLSQLELATLLGWNQSQVARVESGQRDTIYDIRRLIEVADALDMPRATLIPIILGEPESANVQIEMGHDGMSLNRREFAGTLAGVAVAAGLGQVQVPKTVDRAHLHYLVASAERLYAKDLEIGGGALVRDGLRLYYRTRRMLDEARYTDDLGRELMSVAGELAVCVGWLCYDANDLTTAQLLYAEARLFADQSNDDGLAIRAMEKSALQLQRSAREQDKPGHAREAVRLSRRAIELARYDKSPALLALLSAREALAYAAVGDKREFDRSIAQAWNSIHSDSKVETPVWLRFVDTSEIAQHEAKGRRYLGDAEAAVNLYRASVEHPLSLRNSLICRAGLALTLTHAGDVTSAVSEATKVMPAVESGSVSSPRLMSRLKAVRDAAAGNRIGAELRERYDLAQGRLA